MIDLGYASVKYVSHSLGYCKAHTNSESVYNLYLNMMGCLHPNPRCGHTKSVTPSQSFGLDKICRLVLVHAFDLTLMCLDGHFSALW